MPRSRFNAESRLLIVQEIENGLHTLSESARIHTVNQKTLRRWCAVYQLRGADGLTDRKKNVKYSIEFKLKIVRLVTERRASAEDLAIQFGLRTDRLINNWVKKYNESGKLEASPKKRRTPRMTRSTTFDERIKITEDCLANGRHLTATAIKYNVTYQQIRDWVVRYEAGGSSALEDKCGHHKNSDELTEVERLRRENSRLKRALRDQEAIKIFAKKLQALHHGKG